MPLFRKNERHRPQPQERPTFGRGRRLASDLAAEACVETLRGVLESCAPTRYRHMPVLNEAAVLWRGDQPSPAAAWSCSYGADDIFVFTFWPHPAGTTAVGLFPFGGEDGSLSTPLIGQWKQADPTLRSTGLFEAGQLTLLPPRIDADYFNDLLRLGGKAETEANVQR